eukprot:gene8033-12498_t
MSQDKNVIQQAAKAISESNCIYFTAGAGMGVDSGLPDFRGKDGFWRAYPPMKDLGIDLPSTSNPKWFDKDPEFAWGFWAHRFNLYSKSKPHEGYNFLKRFSENKKYGHFVFTSNVDAHFERIFDRENIIEYHGTTKFWQCTDVDCKKGVYEVSLDTKLEIDEKTFRITSGIPKCDVCQKVTRPNVLMFNDSRFCENTFNNQEKNYKKFLRSLNEDDLKMLPNSLEYDSRIVKDSLNQYWFCIPIRFDKRSFDHQEMKLKSQKIASIDPGVRTFSTIYGSDGICLEVAKGDVSRIYRLG